MRISDWSSDVCSSDLDTAATAANDEPAATETAPSSPTPAPATTAAAPAKPAIANPEAKPSTQVSKPVASKPAVRKPAENKAATTVASKSTPWWLSSGNGKGLQVIYVRPAAFERAIVVMGNAPFDNVSSARQNINVTDASGKIGR